MNCFVCKGEKSKGTLLSTLITREKRKKKEKRKGWLLKYNLYSLGISMEYLISHASLCEVDKSSECHRLSFVL